MERAVFALPTFFFIESGNVSHFEATALNNHDISFLFPF